MVKQTYIAMVLKRDQSDISRFLNGKKRVSWTLAKQLAELCPWKNITGWKDANTAEIRRAFEQIGQDA